MVLVDHQIGLDGSERPVEELRAVDGVGHGLPGGHPGQRGDATLNSRSSNRREGLTTLSVSGSDDTASRELRSTSNGWTTARLPLTRVPDQVAADGSTFTVTLFTIAGVPTNGGPHQHRRARR